MMKLLKKTVWKVIAFIVLVLIVTGTLISAAGVIVLIGTNAYLDGGRELQFQVQQEMFFGEMFDVNCYILAEVNDREDIIANNNYYERFDGDNSNLSLTVTDSTGKIVMQNFVCEDFCMEYRYSIRAGDIYLFPEVVDETSVQTGEVYNVVARVRSEMVARDRYYYTYRALDVLCYLRYALIFFTVIGFIAAIILFVILLCSMGYKEGYDGIYLTWLDKIPLDLLITIMIGITLIVAAITSEIPDVIFVLMTGGTAVFLSVILIFSFAARVKRRGWWKNSLIYGIWRLLVRGLRAVWRVLCKLPLYYQAVLVILGFCVYEVLSCIFGVGGIVLCWFLEKMFIICMTIWIVLALRRLQKAGREIAGGNISYKVNLTNMPSVLREHGENINNISVGLSRALDEQMKSERMKAELITNVSHDIKTPLTSIVNYVDLLKKEGLDSPNATEYLSVIDRQSARLRKLTEDLIEASKASSGAIAVDKQPTDLNVLLSQAGGEYEERLASKGLTLVMQLCEGTPMALADGRHMWRVFDNLLSNASKYALSGTRVYLSSQILNGNVVVSFRNVSRDPLPISGDELSERFVRGDASRNTEGSGLGLSIAKSLTELQGGKFTIETDGDLFKVTIVFPEISA